MKLINASGVYYDNDFEKWYFEDNEDFENAQVVDDNYIKENQELKQQLTEKDKKINQLSEEHLEMFGDMKDYKNLWLAEQRKNKEIRKQVCKEVYNFIMDNWEDIMGRQGRYQNFVGTCIDLKNDLEKIAENGYKKGE